MIQRIQWLRIPNEEWVFHTVNFRSSCHRPPAAPHLNQAPPSRHPHPPQHLPRHLLLSEQISWKRTSYDGRASGSDRRLSRRILDPASISRAGLCLLSGSKKNVTFLSDCGLMWPAIYHFWSLYISVILLFNPFLVFTFFLMGSGTAFSNNPNW